MERMDDAKVMYMKSDIRDLRVFLNKICKNSEGFVPMTDDETESIYNRVFRTLSFIEGCL